MQGTMRDGTKGSLSALDANSFGIFTATTGAHYTVHSTEFLADSATADEKKATRAHWASWPVGCLTIRIERKRGRSPSLIVAQSRAGFVYA